MKRNPLLDLNMNNFTYISILIYYYNLFVIILDYSWTHMSITCNKCT